MTGTTELPILGPYPVLPFGTDLVIQMVVEAVTSRPSLMGRFGHVTIRPDLSDTPTEHPFRLEFHLPEPVPSEAAFYLMDEICEAVLSVEDALPPRYRDWLVQCVAIDVPFEAEEYLRSMKAQHEV